MRNRKSAAFRGDTLNLNQLELGEGDVFVDLDVNTAGALTPDNDPSQRGVLRVGEEETRLRNVENIIGSDRGERLFGSEEDGFIRAGGGDDIVHPFNGDDLVDGGDGVDTLLLNAIDGALRVDLRAGFANTADQTNGVSNFENVTGSNLFSDMIAGDRGDNILSGGAGGDDTLKGRGGDDMLLGEAGADHLKGGGGDDALFGGDGADKLVGGRGDDEMTGGDGADRFVFGRRSGEDVVTDLNFAEGDALKLRGFRLVDGEADLIDLATRLNQDGRQNTSATVEGDDLRLEIGSRDILLEDAAAGWSGDSLFA